MTVADQQTCLAATAITNDNDLLGVGGNVCHGCCCRLAAGGIAHHSTDGPITGSLMPSAVAAWGFAATLIILLVAEGLVAVVRVAIAVS